MSRYSDRPLGVVFYEGPSRIDGKPIVAIATFITKNGKTGNLIQTWILREDDHPINAINNGNDESVCGSCPLRGIIDRSSGKPINRQRGCYVAIQNAPANIWSAYKAGRYPKYDGALHSRWFKHRGLRYGSYGEPVAVPLLYWNKIRKVSTGKSKPGYTHLWKNVRFQTWKKYVMASVHSEAEAAWAQAKGWRTYRTVLDANDVQANEILCPASEEAGYTQTCESCGACNGNANGGSRVNITIPVHGGNNRQPSAIKVISEATNG